MIKKRDKDTEAAMRVLLAMAEAGVPADIQELLVLGDPARGIKPGALTKAIAATLSAYREIKEVDERSGLTSQQS